MKTNMIFRWLARIMAILLLLFMAMFSLDSLETPGGAGAVAFAMLMHNLPVLILLAVVIISWKFELVGGVIFTIAGIGFAVFISSRAQPWYMALVASLPLILLAIAVGSLYLASWRMNMKH